MDSTAEPEEFIRLLADARVQRLKRSGGLFWLGQRRHSSTLPAEKWEEIKYAKYLPPRAFGAFCLRLCSRL